MLVLRKTIMSTSTRETLTSTYYCTTKTIEELRKKWQWNAKYIKTQNLTKFGAETDLKVYLTTNILVQPVLPIKVLSKQMKLHLNKSRYSLLLIERVCTKRHLTILREEKKKD